MVALIFGGAKKSLMKPFLLACGKTVVPVGDGVVWMAEEMPFIVE
jgi:hypothetical protein